MATAVETGATLSWIAEIDDPKHPMERPALREYVNGRDEAEALAAAQRLVDAWGDGDVVRRVVPLQPLLTEIADAVASGKRYAMTWKDEGGESDRARFGPVVITDLDAMEAEVPADENGVRRMAVPFGTEPSYDTVLPWMNRSDAKRLATYLGLRMEES
jgi:hypothetical protein